MRRHVFIVFGWFVVVALLLSACGSQGPASTQPTAVQPTAAQPGGTEPTAAQPGGTEPTAAQPTADSSTGKVTLTFWHTMNESETPTLLELVNKAAAEAGVEVKVEYVPFDGARDKWLTAAQGGNAPDVFRAEIAWTPLYADAGFLLDITDKLSADDKQDYLAAPLAYNMYQDKVWGIPQVTDAPALLYNKALAEAAGLDPTKPPATMDEFAEWCQKLTKPDGSQYGFFFTDGVYFFQPFMWAFGGGLIDGKDMSIHITDPGSIDAANFVLKLRDEYKCMPQEFDPRAQYDNAMGAFKEGKAAMIFNGPWATGDILKGEQFKDVANLGVAAIPKGPKGQGSPVGGHNYVVYAGTPHPDEAYKFMAALNSTENQGVLATKLNLLPTRMSAYELPDVQTNPILQGFRQQMEVATNRPVIPQSGQLYDAFGPAWEAILAGSKSPADAFKEVADAWTKLLEE